MQPGAKHNMDYLIIGGGIAGTTAAETIRGLDEQGSIAIVSKEPYELYSRVLLPKYVEGVLLREQVFLRTPEDYNKRNINLFADEEATIVDVKRKEVRTRQGTIFFYKHLLISAGGRVKPWRVEGALAAPIMRFQTIDDAEALRNYAAKTPPPAVVIVGGGFIALELLNALVPRGISNMRCFLPERRYWEPYIDTDGSTLLETHLERNGVSIHHEEIVATIQQNEKGSSTLFTNKRNSYEADLVVVGIGLDREVEPFSGMGIEVHRGLKTNEFLETGVEDIWAAGDVAEAFHPVFGKHILAGNWNNAFLQGRAAGINMVSRHMKTDAKQAFLHIPLYALDVLGMHVAFLGHVPPAEEKDAEREYLSRFERDTWYERFILQNGKLVGAVLINKFEDRSILERLIVQQRDIMPYSSFLKDSSAKLSDVISL